ncbi:hypothetical protein K2F40_10890 [Clostridium sp. CM028]|uniref:hypothetical protein n=1 Tax=unclassified Clostridium TaxID=2614128 RepID=UPI001C0E21B7|nr:MULTISPECIES: hypothetical protein [unclassified Clostridium]MBU3092698.1 hypothetical protein [Clostridium sp. CF011]MBW9145616.1 hypothetical protein [Clostridium sp. CM027]MBW9149466.1 hypothetical protein [Clostridium sp. CM028]UVE41530.1 hypothetical protein KTC92_03265 [Clostridium sp. CM027]WAG70530.1 hypothetical protein LL036_03550 [Clostridium sp. CF011]
MLKSLLFIPANLINPIISSVSIIIGAILGGVFSWFINKNSTNIAIERESKIEKANREHQKQSKSLRLSEYAAIIQLDICTTLFQSLRMLKEIDDKNKISIYPIPMNFKYAEAIVALDKIFSLKEMSYIYQLYGIIEKLNNDIKGYHCDEIHYTLIKGDFETFIKKIYGNNFSKALAFDIDKATYENLYDNEIIKPGYKNVLIKLNRITY